jgi:rubrerythrin
MDFKSSQTCQNLLSAYAGETQANSRYQLFSKRAKSDGYMVIYNIFDLTAKNELMHADRFLGLLTFNGCPTPANISGNYPIAIGDTLANLQESASSEAHEYEEVYPAFAKTAEEEGFKDIAFYFNAIAQIELDHSKTFATLAQLVSNNFFKRSEAVVWRCKACGHTQVGTSPWQQCPVCSHPQSYAEVAGRNL